MSKDVKLKKKHRFLATKIVVIFSTVFVVAPVATFMGLFYVPNTKDVSNVTGENLQTTLTNRLFKSISDIDTSEEGSPELKLTFDDETLDGLLMYVNKTLTEKTDTVKYLPKFYCTINDNKYNFYADIRSALLKTRLEINTTLDNTKEYELRFTIDNIKLGRINFNKNTIGSITSKYINDENINSALKESGFEAKVDFENMQLTYTREKFQENMKTFLTEYSKNIPEMNAIFGVLGTGELEFTTSYKNGLTIGLPLSKLVGEDVKIPVSSDLKLDMKTTNEKVLAVVNHTDFKRTDYYLDKSIDDITSDLTVFYNYGYQQATNEEKSHIQELIDKNKKIVKEKLTEGVEPESYPAKITDISETLIDSDTLEELATTKGKSVDLTSKQINSYLNHFKFIGKPYSLSLKTDDGYQNAFLAVDNFCFGLDENDENKFKAFISISVNGLNIKIAIPITSDTASLVYGKLSLKIGNDIKIGKITVNKDIITELCKLFNVSSSNFSFTDGVFSMTFDALKEHSISFSINDDKITLQNDDK